MVRAMVGGGFIEGAGLWLDGAWVEEELRLDRAKFGGGTMGWGRGFNWTGLGLWAGLWGWGGAMGWGQVLIGQGLGWGRGYGWMCLGAGLWG